MKRPNQMLGHNVPTGTRSMGEVLEVVFEALAIKTRLNETRVIEDWETMMGPTIANRTKGLNLFKQVLTVSLSSAPLRQQLTGSKARVLQIITEHCGPGVVVDIVFK